MQPRVRALGPVDRDAILGFCASHPARDVFIASRVLNDGALRPGWRALWGAFEGDELAAILHLGPNLTVSARSPEALDALSGVATGPSPARLFVGERRCVRRLWSTVRRTYPQPREVRDRQYVFSVDAGLLLNPRSRAPGSARLATRADEATIAVLSAAMHHEEMGEDPLARDPIGYRARIRMLIDRGWTYVFEVAGTMAFKMDVGCASPQTAQLQGVYTPPELRGRGLATTGMAACCALALRTHASLSLYVNDFNRPAVALYERLGFLREPYDFTTVMLP